MGLGAALSAASGLAFLNSTRKDDNSSADASSSSGGNNSSNGSLESQAANVLFENLTTQLKQTVNDSKIGQVVPHMDTPAVNYGAGISQKCAKVLMRQPAMPFPKLAQLESLSDLFHAYQEAYPQRLDIFCVLIALFPLVSLKMQKEYKINIYIAPALSCYRFSQYYSRKSVELTIGHEIMQKTLHTLLVDNALQAWLNSQAAVVHPKVQLGPRLHAFSRWFFDKYIGLVKWSLGHNTGKVGNALQNGNEKYFDGSNVNNNNYGGPNYGGNNYGGKGMNYGGMNGGMNGGMGMDESFHVVPRPGENTQNPSNSANPPSSSWMPGSGQLPEWMREFEARASSVLPNNPFSSSPNTASNPELTASNSQLANPEDYHQIVISKEALMRFFKYAGFCYTIPGLVIPAQFLFGVNFLSGRVMVGPLTPGKKIWYPFEEMVEMLPSLSSPGKDPNESRAARNSSRWLQQTSVIGLSIAVVGCGVLGVIFGGMGSLGRKSS